MAVLIFEHFFPKSMLLFRAVYLNLTWRLHFLQGHHGLNFYSLSYIVVFLLAWEWLIFLLRSWQAHLDMCCHAMCTLVVLLSSLQRSILDSRDFPFDLRQWRKTQINTISKRAQVKICNNIGNFTKHPSEFLMYKAWHPEGKQYGIIIQETASHIVWRTKGWIWRQLRICQQWAPPSILLSSKKKHRHHTLKVEEIFANFISTLFL